MDKLSKRALSPAFFDNILNEYLRDGQMQSFYKEVIYMGMLKNASYASFGLKDTQYLRESKKYLDLFRDITTQMRDKREPYPARRPILVNRGDDGEER